MVKNGKETFSQTGNLYNFILSLLISKLTDGSSLRANSHDAKGLFVCLFPPLFIFKLFFFPRIDLHWHLLWSSLAFLLSRCQRNSASLHQSSASGLLFLPL